VANCENEIKGFGQIHGKKSSPSGFLNVMFG